MDALILTGVVIGAFGIVSMLYLKYKEKKEREAKSQDKPNQLTS